MILTPDDGTELYIFDLTETTKPPKIEVMGEVNDTLTGVSVYSSPSSDYVFAVQADVIAAYDFSLNLVGSVEVGGLEDVEIQGISMHQAATETYPNGLIGFALEADDFQGFGISSLAGVLQDLGIEPNLNYDPRKLNSCRRQTPIKDQCSYMGYLQKSNQTCECFTGTEGANCETITCADNCSNHGTCIGPNTCQCEAGWGGLHCSFLLVQPLYETEANGADGDDPAIWISPKAPELSRIITTTKTEQGAGLGVFDLSGKGLQVHYSEQPNNVDIIYGFQAGNRTVDLAYAACRGDNTLW